MRDSLVAALTEGMKYRWRFFLISQGKAGSEVNAYV